MRVCAKHFKPATDTLKSFKTGEEFDLCPQCEIEIREIIYGPADDVKSESEQPQRIDGHRRAAGRPKKKVA
jgi:hypothetical protein